MIATTLDGPDRAIHPAELSAAGPLPTRRTPRSPTTEPPANGAIEELAERALAGQPDAVTELVTTVRPLVVRYCRSRLGRRSGRYELADDVAQETCLAMVRGLSRFRDMGRPFLAFVYGIAGHKVADAQRRERRAPLPVREIPDDTDDGPGPEDVAVRVLQARQARDLLKSLPRQQREVVLLRVAGAMPAAEVGEALGMSVTNVRVQQHRALAQLRRMLSPDDVTG